MKQIYFLLISMLPFIGIGQTITNTSFDSNITGWSNGTVATGTVSWDNSEGSNAIGSLKLIATVINDRAQTTPNANPIGGAGDYKLTFKVKGSAGNKVSATSYQASNIKYGASMILTGGWDTYSTILPDVNTVTMNLRIIAENIGTYYIDDIIWTKITTNKWTGTTSSSWNTSSNWSLNTVPTSADDIVISSNGIFAPIIDTDVTIPAGKSLTISSTGTLTINPGKTLTIAGSADFGNKPVTFKSDITGTGMLGILTGVLSRYSSVTAERYIPGRRAFRFLSSPVTTTSSINQHWQENGGSTAGLGTHITGSGGTSNGFDATATNNPSLFTYDNSSQSWNAVLNTNTNVLTAGVPYRIMVRGDRTTNLGDNAATASNTVLRTTGSLFTGTKNITDLNTSADGYSFIGNPYQAPVNMQSILSSATNLKNFYYVWDPTLGARGAYVARDLTSGTNSITSNVDNYLQPGQACFVQTTAAGAASLTFTEANKYTTATNSLVFRPASAKNTNASSSIRLTLFNKNSTIPTDGTLVVFNTAGNNALDANDAGKMTNLDENLAIKNENKLLSIENRASASSTDEILLDITQYRAADYTLVVYVFKLKWTFPKRVFS